MKKGIFKRFLVSLLVLCTLMTQGNIVAFATESTGGSLDDARLMFRGVVFEEGYVKTLRPGEEDTAEVVYLPTDEEFTITWSSADETVVSIDQNGKLTGIKEGRTTISAHIQGENSSKTITVETWVEDTYLTVNEEFKVGQQSNAYIMNLPKDKEVTTTWSSSDESIMSINQSGLCVALKEGTVIISAHVQGDDYDRTFEAEIEVSDYHPYINLDSLFLGEQHTVHVEDLPEDKEYTIQWSSSDESILSISQEGVYKGLKVGEVTVTAQVVAEDYSETFEKKVTVMPIVTAVYVYPTTVELEVGETFQLEADVHMVRENEQYRNVTWTSANPNVVVVDENGCLIAKNPGSTYVEAKATDGSGETDTCSITVLSDNYPDSGVQLFKNGVLVGNYETVNEAFDLMTDKNADYTIILCSDQLLEGYAQWPKVKSIKIVTPMVKPESEYGTYTSFVISESVTTFNSDVTVADWICVSPLKGTQKINLQNYTFTFTEDMPGHYPQMGYNSLTEAGGFDVVGGNGSKILVETNTTFLFGSLDVDVVEITAKNAALGSWVDLRVLGLEKDSHIGTLLSNGKADELSVSGSDNKTTKLTINKLDKYVVFFNAENVDIEIKDVASDVELDLRYASRDALKTGSFTYTGKTKPTRIYVDVNASDKGHGGGIRDGEALNPFLEDTVLLYAPYVKSGVEFNSFLQEDYSLYGMSYVIGGYRISGTLSSSDGYYYTKDIPVIIPSQMALIFADEGQKSITYTDVNSDRTPQSITWTANASSRTGTDRGDITNEVIGAYDGDSLEITYTNRNTDEYAEITGVFNYDDVEVRIGIPMFPSESASDVSFSKEKIVTTYYMFNYQEIELNFTSDGSPIVLVSSSDAWIAHPTLTEDNKIGFYVGGTGTATIRAYVGDEIVECEVIVTEARSDGWNQAEDGNWYYYKNGEVDTSVNGIVPNGDKYWYAVNGKADFTATLVAKYGKEWWYVGNGVVDFTYFGVAPNASGSLYYVKNGKVNFNVNGLVRCGSSTDWYYFKNGKVQVVETLIKNTNNGNWYYVKGGKVQFGYTGVAKNTSNGNWFYVAKGKVDFTYDGVAPNAKGALYYVENGKVDFSKAGILKCSGKYYYFKKGKVQEVDTVVKNASNGNYYAVWNGVVDLTFDGVASNDKGTYYIENGKVDFTKAGILKRGTKWYYFKKGKVQKVDTIAKNTSNGNWYAVWDGVVDLTFEGIASNDNGMYYCQKGKVNFGFTGTVTYNGHTYKVVKGKATLIQ